MCRRLRGRRRSATSIYVWTVITTESAMARKRELVWILIAFLAFLFFSDRAVLGDVRLPAFFSDDMVLQQGRKIAIWE